MSFWLEELDPCPGNRRCKEESICTTNGAVYLCHVDDRLEVVPEEAAAALSRPVPDFGRRVVCYQAAVVPDSVLVPR